MYSHPAGSSFEFSSLSIPLRGMSAQRPSAQGLGSGRGQLAGTRPARGIQVQRRGRTNGSTGTGYTNLYKTPIGQAQSSLHRAKGPCIHDILGKARDILRGFLLVPWLFKCHVRLLPLHLQPLSPSSRFVSCERVGAGNLLIYLHFHLRQPRGVRLRNSERGSSLETKCREQSKRARVSCVVQKDTTVLCRLIFPLQAVFLLRPVYYWCAEICTMLYEGTTRKYFP